MEGNRKGSKEISEEEILAPKGEFAVTPLDMKTEKHVLSAMYGLADRLTIAFMLPYLTKTMEHQITQDLANKVGHEKFETSVSGFGDAQLSFVNTLIPHGQKHSLVASVGFRLPTGSIKKEDYVPVPLPEEKRRLPYPMQLGSGSYAFAPSLTYQSYFSFFSFGFQLAGVYTMNRNSKGYRLGDQQEASPWLAFLVSKNFSLSWRVKWQKWKNIKGKDKRIATHTPNGMLRSVPTAQPDLRGGERTLNLLGINFEAKNQKNSQRISLEYGTPSSQKLEGPQLGQKSIFVLSLQSTYY